MEKAAAKPPLPHDLILESRSKLTVTGVQKVLNDVHHVVMDEYEGR